MLHKLIISLIGIILLIGCGSSQPQITDTSNKKMMEDAINAASSNLVNQQQVHILKPNHQLLGK